MSFSVAPLVRVEKASVSASREDSVARARKLAPANMAYPTCFLSFMSSRIMPMAMNSARAESRCMSFLCYLTSQREYL